jgi:hypothetical protein
MLEHVIEAIRRMRRRGATCREVAAELGVGKSSVHRVSPGYRKVCPRCHATLTTAVCLACRLESPKPDQETSRGAGMRPAGDAPPVA